MPTGVQPADLRKRSANPLQHHVVKPTELANLKQYKYSGADWSLCSKYFMQTYWSFVVTLVPMNVAPNMLTLLGFFASTSTSVLLLYFWLCELATPNWVWGYAAVSLFVYQTLDAIDGKQARRTGCGSPLGELFDHGCDALFTPLLQVTVCLAVDYSPMQSFLQCYLVCTGLFFSIFEQYSTGTLDLGYINGPVEGILITCGCLAWSSVVGPSWWSTPFATPLEIANVGGFDIAIRRPHDFTFYFMLIAFVFTCGTNLLHTATLPVAHDRIQRALPFIAQMLLSALVAGVVYMMPAVLSTRLPFVLEMAYGVTCSFTVTRLTIARLCRAKYDPFSWPYIITATICLWLFALYPHLDDVTRPTHPFVQLMPYPILAAAVFNVVAYLHMIIAVFRQFSQFLGINVLTMTAEQKRRIAEKKA